MLSNFWYQPLVAVSGNLGRKILVVGDVLSFHKQEICPTISPDEDDKEFEFQTDRNYYIDLRHTYLAYKLKLVKGRGNETYNAKEKKEHKEEAKTDEETEEEQEIRVPVVTHVKNILHSIFFNVEVYINNQHFYSSYGMYAHKFFFQQLQRGHF